MACYLSAVAAGINGAASWAGSFLGGGSSAQSSAEQVLVEEPGSSHGGVTYGAISGEALSKAGEAPQVITGGSSHHTANACLNPNVSGESKPSSTGPSLKGRCCISNEACDCCSSVACIAVTALCCAAILVVSGDCLKKEVDSILHGNLTTTQMHDAHVLKDVCLLGVVISGGILMMIGCCLRMRV